MVDIPYGGAIKINNTNNNTNYIEIFAKTDEKTKKEIDYHLNNYGYFQSFYNILSNGHMNLTYEKKYDVDITDFIREKGVLYHVCRKDVIKKITNIGLTPRENEWISFKNQPRIYLFYEELSDTDLDEWIFQLNIGKKKKSNTYCLLSIDVSKIKNNPKFYIDPRLNGTTYTYDNINPEAIKIIKERKLDY